MNRTLYDTQITAVRINADITRVTADNYTGHSVKHSVLPKQWEFLEDVLEAFMGDGDPVSAILGISKEYKGYG